VTRAGYTGSVDSAPTVTVTAARAAITISFSQIADAAPPIIGPTLSRTGSPAEATLTVADPEQYTSINWQVQNTPAGIGPSFTLRAVNYPDGQYLVSVEVVKDGAPWNTTVSFTVVN
jgi:hypothetical protein